MKKITLGLIALFSFAWAQAQDTCATAAVVTAGTTTVAAVNGTEVPTPECAANAGGVRTAGEWYIYTPLISGSVNITTDLVVNAGGDTRFHVYSGDCGSLTCIGGNDDVSGTNYLSDGDFNVVSGNTYYIAWDNLWSPAGFDFVLTETPATCLQPSGFVADDITATTFDLSWTDDNTNSPTWEIEYGAPAFVQGTGTTVSNIATPSYQFTGLDADTSYEFYIRANCGMADGDSEWVGPIAFTSGYDCDNYGLPFTENWASDNAFFSCYTVEDGNTDDLAWTFNTANDLDGDGTNDNIVNIFPQAANVAKDDWLFLPAISGTAGNDYIFTFTYNAVDFNGIANESFEVVALNEASSTASSQTVLGTYTDVSMSGTFQGTMGTDLITQAYSDNVTYTPSASGDFYFAIRATTAAADSDVFFFLTLEVSEVLSLDDFEANSFKHYYNKTSDILTLDSATAPLTGVEIYSILGQQVISKTLNNSTEEINLSELNDGIYLAKVFINGNSKTVKIIKQ
ncbi:MAG: hypothetical protein BM564_08275 [Bacteroidetes bacterium MedPE-SWsnd-G2]|nr:MAG: hypothetical protein BM564_08275 [Bacteroidetes bacterium MedPE-SWsnd-G2]